MIHIPVIIFSFRLFYLANIPYSILKIIKNYSSVLMYFGQSINLSHTILFYLSRRECLAYGDCPRLSWDGETPCREMWRPTRPTGHWALLPAEKTQNLPAERPQEVYRSNLFRGIPSSLLRKSGTHRYLRLPDEAVLGRKPLWPKPIWLSWEHSGAHGNHSQPKGKEEKKNSIT